MVPPPGVTIGIVRAWCAPRCTKYVKRIAGNPSAMTTTAPGNTQSGRPMAMIAARATIVTATNAAAQNASARARRGRPPRRISGMTGCPPPLVTLSRTFTRSAALCGRESGSFSTQRITSSARRGGVSARISPIGRGASDICAASSWCGVRPWNGGCPPSISYAMTPKA